MAGPKNVHARRLSAQLLAGRPARSALDVVDRLLAVQAQDPRAARLAIRARTAGVSNADIERELTDERSLVITTLNRGTLHLIRSEDYPLLQSLTTPQLMTAVTTRLGQDGLDPDTSDRAVDLIDRSIAEEGPMTRAQLRERLERAGIPHLQRGFVHLVFRASIQGRIVRGPMIGRQHAFARVADWLSPAPPPPRAAALAELARRYLAGHGPASDRDLARWANLPLREVRAGLGAIASQLRDLGHGLIDLNGRGHAAPLPPPRLLGAFEPLLLGWCSREAVLGTDDPRVISGGVFRNFALVAGRGVAVWRLTGSRIQIEPFTALSPEDRAALDHDADAVVRFLRN
jgi:hypothetical protein